MQTVPWLPSDCQVGQAPCPGSAPHQRKHGSDIMCWLSQQWVTLQVQSTLKTPKSPLLGMEITLLITASLTLCLFSPSGFTGMASGGAEDTAQSDVHVSVALFVPCQHGPLQHPLLWEGDPCLIPLFVGLLWPGTNQQGLSHQPVGQGSHWSTAANVGSAQTACRQPDTTRKAQAVKIQGTV